jgi:hypothetical protein
MAKAMLPKDRPQKPGFLGRTSIKTVEGRTGYTENETRFGQNAKSTKIPMPKAGGK